MSYNNQKIFAIILNYNSSQDTIPLYYQLKAYYEKYLNFLVIDNHSLHMDVSRLKRTIPRDQLIMNRKNFGYAGGNNIGIEVALSRGADYIWILNPDIRVSKECLPILLKTITSNVSLAAVGARIHQRLNEDLIFSDGEVIDTEFSFHTHHKNFNKKSDEVPVKIDYDVDYIDGSCIILNSKAIKDVGKFSEEYFLYFEETDWCTRAKRMDWKLAVNRAAKVYNLTSNKKEIYHYYYTRNKLCFAKKFNFNYSALKKEETEKLFAEIKDRFRGKYFRPYFYYRLKGLIQGLLLTKKV